MRFPGQSGGGYGHGLVTVRVCCSCILAADVGTVWRIVRDFSSCWAQGADLYGGQRVACLDLLGGAPGTTVGALRTLSFASLQSKGQFLEKLVALDDIEHYTRWQTVSHDANVNPFPGAYLNADSCLRLRPVTASCQTLLELEATFLTEAGQAEAMQLSIDRHLNAAMATLQHSVALLPQLASASGSTAGSVPLASQAMTSSSLAPFSTYHQGPTQQAPITLQDLAGGDYHCRSSLGPNNPSTFHPQPSWSSIETSSCQAPTEPDWFSSGGLRSSMPNLPPGPSLPASRNQSVGASSGWQRDHEDLQRPATSLRSQQKALKEFKMGWQSENSAGSGGRATPDGPAALSPKAPQSPRTSRSPAATPQQTSSAASVPQVNAASSQNPPPNSTKLYPIGVSPQFSSSRSVLSAPTSPSGPGSVAASLRHISSVPLQRKLSDTLQRKHSGALQRLHPEHQKVAASGSRPQRLQQSAQSGPSASHASPYTAAATAPEDLTEHPAAGQALHGALDVLHQGSPCASGDAQQAHPSQLAYASQPAAGTFAAGPSGSPSSYSPFASSAIQHGESSGSCRTTQPVQSAPVQSPMQQTAAAPSHSGRMRSPFATHVSQHCPASLPVQSDLGQSKPVVPANHPDRLLHFSPFAVAAKQTGNTSTQLVDFAAPHQGLTDALVPIVDDQTAHSPPHDLHHHAAAPQQSHTTCTGQAASVLANEAANKPVHNMSQCSPAAAVTSQQGNASKAMLTAQTQGQHREPSSDGLMQFSPFAAPSSQQIPPSSPVPLSPA
ncbi:hypothetical protein WJX74_000500 [Apatococcus lobatus]|uniref:Uncharacterized protein n=1 Tax=Apatococcus lobatus TaxID=904363 RepID=A0AAW1QXK1_9CHLO